METHFAPPGRSSDAEVKKEIETASKNAVVDELLHSVGGVLAVLNEHRQILAVNDGLIEMLGIPDAYGILGLRPGEAVGCIHCNEMPGGCGTSEACASCGAVISILASLTSDKAEEGTCALTIERGGKRQDMYFRVRCAPVRHSEKRFLLLFLQDITYHQRLAALERVFFHDINNVVAGILNATHLLTAEGPEWDEDTERLLQVARNLSVRLANEIQIQRAMSEADADAYRATYESFPVEEIVRDVEGIFTVNAVSKGKRLSLPGEFPPVSLTTDSSLIIRVLNNMVTNAFEETEEGGEVRLWVEQVGEKIVFSVWNGGYITPDIAARIFQRNFSTKAKLGRGYGTYSMKFFGEDILGGEVDFTTSEKDGTVFRFSLKV